MINSLQLFRVPDELDYLTRERPHIAQGRPREIQLSSYGGGEHVPSLSGAASVRLATVARLELDSETSVAHPAWLGGQAIPRLIVFARYEGRDAFGASRLLADLDVAARRAGALYRRLARGEKPDRWPTPIRTYEGGLRLLDARVGSFDIASTFWGGLVTMATSSPMAVAGMLALAWDVGRGSIGIANRWIGAALAESQADRPSLDPPEGGEIWGVRHTKALVPVMETAVSTGQGFEYYLNEQDLTVKLVVPPRELGREN